jgi:hypothetical protein
MAREIKITIETESLLILRGHNSLRAWCPQCGADSEMIDLDSAGVISNLAPREIEEWLESEELHRSEAADGSSFICLNSLLRRVRNKRIT